MRKHASDRVKFLNQQTIERLLGDDNCYSQSSGEYCETALRERLIELKTTKACVMGSKGYDEMLVNEQAQHEASGDVVGMFAARPRYVRPIERPVVVKTEVKFNIKVKQQYKFIIRY